MPCRCLGVGLALAVRERPGFLALLVIRCAVFARPGRWPARGGGAESGPGGRPCRARPAPAGRLDGPAGPYTPPPSWATPELPADAIRVSATRAHIDGPTLKDRTHSFAFGEPIDTRIIRSTAFQGGTTITEGKVAGYVAKYATKGTEAATGTLDHRLKEDHRPLVRVRARARRPHDPHRLALGARNDLKHLNLRKWAHRLGFRGHFSTKTRAYSTTLSALRAARATWHRRQDLRAPRKFLRGPQPSVRMENQASV
ncbi:replication initiator [Streptomyces sp. NPDC059949]|uniref:replication initiator n=1 Tax=Streptomyces sp. NPDC059949 TaxID=3347013 RepID=UPI00364FF0C4